MELVIHEQPERCPLQNVLGYYVFTFEKNEKKKLLLSNQFKGITEHILSVVKLLLKPLQFNAKTKGMPRPYTANYINGCVPQIVSIINSMITISMTRLSTQQPKISHTYQQTKTPSEVGFTFLNGSIVLTKIPADLNDLSANHARVLVLLEALDKADQDPLKLQEFPFVVEDVHYHDHSPIFDVLRRLIVQDSYQNLRGTAFLSFSFDILKMISRSDHLAQKLVKMLIDCYKTTTGLT